MTTASEAVDATFERVAAAFVDGVWIEVVERDRAMAAAAAVDARVAAGERLALAGRTIAVKGNIDLAGLRTTAGCPSFGAVAETSASVVLALESAGAVVVGTTNLDQFATGLTGTRTPHGPCPNLRYPGLVAGGSSAGSGAAVAAGLVDLAIGTDTAGSGRIPAAAGGIVGVKPTRGRISTRGIVAACRSLDCASTFAATVDLAVLAADLAAGFDPNDPWSRPEPPPTPGPDRRLRLGIPRAVDVVGDGAGPGGWFAPAASALAESVGADAVAVDLGPFLAAGRLLYEGAFVAERYAAVGPFVDAGSPDLDPTVAGIIATAGRLPAWRLAADRTRLAAHAQAMAPTWLDVDVIVMPTAPAIPTLAAALADPVGSSTALGTYTNAVNLLDLCAIALPVAGAGPAVPPRHVTLVAPAWKDQLLARIARQVEPAHAAAG